jgi:hypothetical protein
VAQRLAAVEQPPSEKPRPEETEIQRKLELLKKVRTLKERARHRLGIENGDPAKVYVWVHNSDTRRQHFESLEYRVCRDPKVSTRWKREDGTHVCGDLILYEIDKELHDTLKLESLYRAVEAIEGSRSDFLAFAERNRVPVLEHN